MIILDNNSEEEVKKYLYEFKKKLQQIYLTRGISDNFNPNKYYKAVMLKFIDRFSDAKNTFEIHHLFHIKGYIYRQIIHRYLLTSFGRELNHLLNL